MKISRFNHIKSHSVKRKILLTLTLLTPLMITSGAARDLLADQCVQTDTVKCTCSNSANRSWLQWINGNSRSTQFQFIDLFELVNSPKHEATKKVIPTREG